MAKADVTMVFDAGTAQAVNELLKLREKMLQTGDAARKMGKDAAEGGGAFQEAFKGVAESLGLVTTVAGAAGFAVELTLKTTENYVKRLEERAAAVRAQVGGLSGALASAGQISRFPEINRTLGEMAGQTVGGAQFSKAELSRVYAGVSGQLGFKASPDEIVKSLGAYQKAKAGAMDETAAMDVAVQYARLAPAGNQDMALAAHVAGLSEDDMRAYERAPDKAAMLNMILASKKVSEGPRTMQAIEAMAALAGETGHLDPKERHEQRKLKALIGGGDPMSTILAHPELLADEKQREAARSIARGAADLATHPMTTLDQQIEAARSIPSLRFQQAGKGTTAVKEQTDETQAAEVELARVTLLNKVIADERKESMIAQLMPDWLLGGGGTGKHEAMRLEPEMYKDYQRQKKKAGLSYDPIVDAINDMHRTLQDQNATLRTRRDTTLSNDNEGQK